ncbi:hypothetical protein D3C76_1693970 [compost metagenome]
MADGVAHRHLAPHRIEAVLRRQDQQVGGFAYLKPVARLHVEGTSAVLTDQLQAVIDLLVSH